uniref:SH3 domain-containing protein n=1 Tax=Meloidogyne javanica TaxID=6303 RepID=A0A915LTC5_MELJA
SELSIELQRENFHDFENIRSRERDIFSRWNKFLAILEQKEQELGRLGELSNLLGELEELKEELTQMGKELGRQRIQENCKHLAAVDELLRKLELTENNIRAKKEWLIQLDKKAKQYVKTVSSNIGGNEQLSECLNEREQQLNYLQSELKQHRAALQRAKEFFQFIAHWEEQISWLTDRLSLCQSLSTTRDLSNISQSQRAHKSLEAEMAGQWERTKLLIGDGERLNQPEEVHGRLEILQKKWEELRIANIALLSWIREADRLQQYFQDANETESWIRERMPLAQSEDFGRDIALYAYNGNNKNKNGGNVFVSRGEELALLDNSNKDWWRVLTQTGMEGYLPSNYCELINDENKIRDEINNQGQTQFSQLTEMSEQLITQCNNINSYSHSRVGEEQPERAEEVQAKVQSLEAMHAELLAQARAWIEQAERSQGQQMFEQAASELLDWTQKCSEQINLPCDLFSSSSSSLPSASEEAAEEALRRNSELREQIDGKQFEFGYVEELGQRLIEKGYPKEQVKQKLEELEHARNDLEFQWQKREEDCRRLLELQAFTREADRINSLNRGQLAFLDLSLSQADSVEKVQNLLKGQAEFEAKLSAQEERVLLFVASADRLIRTGHTQSAQIENQKREVICGHQGVIERTQMRRAQLERGLALEGLRRDASELGLWINEKRHQMEQQNEVGGVGGLNWAQTRHQAFMLELPANRAELSRLAKSGAALIRDGVAEREAVANVLEPLEVEWTKLETLARQRGDLLGQEEQKVALLEEINEVNGKIEEIENRLSDKTKGKDLRGVKQLINKNVQTGQEIQLLEERLNEISEKVNKMNEKKHFAVPELIEKVEELVVRFNSLHEPLERMRAELDESMGWHQLAFDVDVELQWIGEKKLIVECPQFGHSLTEVQQLVKRHEQLTAELDCHQPLVTELLNKGGKLANADGINKHSCHQEIDAKCLELSNSWKKLMELSAKRRNLLNRALSREQLLFELSEAENWLSEKNKQLQTREEGAISEGHGGAQTLLAWLKTLQNELGPFHSSL